MSPSIERRNLCDLDDSGSWNVLLVTLSSLRRFPEEFADREALSV